GRINAHEHIGLVAQPAILYFEISAQQAGHALERIHITKHRQRIHGGPGLKALAQHGGTAYALALALRVVTADSANDACGQQIAGRFAGDHTDTHVHDRTMPRVELARKSTMVWMASLARGRSC